MVFSSCFVVWIRLHLIFFPIYPSIRCTILKCVPNSALWLLRFPAAGEMRLRACMFSHSTYLLSAIRRFSFHLATLPSYNFFLREGRNSLCVCWIAMFNYWTLYRCSCSRSAARSNYFHRCSYEEWTYQTQFFSWFIPWHVNFLFWFHLRSSKSIIHPEILCWFI